MSRSALRRCGAAAVALWLVAGCAAIAPQPAPDLAGRLSVRVEAAADTAARSLSADFDLRGNAERGTLSLTGPLGATLAQVRWQPGTAELSDAQGQRRYPTLDALAQDLLGEALPLAALIDWLRGRPWPGAPSQPRDDGFEQLGWQIGLAQFGEGLVVARRTRAPAVDVRARLERPA